MSAYNPSAPSLSGARPHYGAQHHSPALPAAPVGTFAPGTKIQVGSHKVVIQKYFSEGGFAHVYLVKMPSPKDGTDIAILKRVAVPDKEALTNMRTEVETMKKLKGHRPIVTYYDSHASQLKGGGYEVFLLMEFCNGGGLIDFMNTRLQNRLTEPEILKIFSDVTEGVACMHYLKPPLLHRDLKVENVLISTSKSGNRRYKLCDFGSTAPPQPAATTAAECRLIEDDVQKHTTLQYRSPEMIDVYRKQPIDEKSDIWALGVLLYKLCYYTTPFEEQGQLAILNASFKFPSYPPFSDRLKKLIASMLRENPKQRPNVYQVLREACLMQGIEVPIKDIYSGRTDTETRRDQELPAPPPNKSPAVGAIYSPPVPLAQLIPEVVPMRRGRPTTSHQSQPKPNPSPMRGNNSDPFAALDSKTSPSRRSDELSSRFPSLDQFSLLHDKGAKFEFDAYSPTETKPKDLNQRVTEALADDAFVSPPVKPAASPSMPSGSVMSRAQKIISSTPELQSAISAPPATTTIQAPTPFKPSMVSTGTMTSPSPPVIEVQPNQRKYNPSPIYRFPPADHHRSVSLGRTSSPEIKPSVQEIEIARPSTSRNSSSYLRPAQDSYSASSRPSLESGRPSPHSSNDDFESPVRTKSTDPRPRPSSAYLESHMDYLREKELAQSSSHSISKPGFLKSYNIKPASPPFPSPEVSPTDNSPLDSNVDFLRTIESSSSSTIHRKEKERRSTSSSSGSKHVKRASLPSMALNGTKNLFAGKFGDAFKRFENNANQRPRTPSPESIDHRNFDRRELLTPIAGSEATDGRSDDGRPDDEDAAMNPEKRRELERRRLEDEERRVEEAAREYRQRLAEREAGAPLPRSIAGVTRASTIQNKVKSLLEENERSDREVRRTAEGYGRFTEPDRLPTQAAQAQQSAPQPPPSFAKPVVARKPVQGRPSAPPKPVHLHTGPGGGAVLQHTTSLPAGHGGSGLGLGSSPPKPAHLQGGVVRPLTVSQTRPGTSSQLQLQRSGLGLGISGGGDGGDVGGGSKGVDPYNMTFEEREDYVADFAKRFPSLSGIEMVETVVEGRRSVERRR